MRLTLLVSPWILSLTLQAPAQQAQPKASLQELERRMAELINLEREARGIHPLAYDEKLAEVARDHSRTMAKKGKVGHDLGGPQLEERIRKVRPKTCQFGENLSKHTSIDYALGDLMLSPGHRENLLAERFSQLGVGIAESGKGFLYITQNFTHPCPEK